MNELQKLEHKQEVERARAARFYDNNKERVNEERRQKYKDKQTAIAQQAAATEQERMNLPVKSIKGRKIVINPNIIEVKPTVSKNGKLVVIITDNNVNKKYLTYFEQTDKYKPNSKLKYIGDIKRVISLIPAIELQTAVKTNKIQELISNSKYANNTKVNMAKIVLTALSGLNNELTKTVFDKYSAYVESLQRNVANDLNDKQQNDTVMSFKTYLDKVRTEFGNNHKMTIIATLYDEVTARDDFQLKLVEKTPNKNDLTENYLVLSKSQYRVIITQHKTDSTNGAINQLLSKELTALLKKYIMCNDIQIGQYLFGDEQLSGYISYNNKKIGVDGGINLFRHMKITEMHNDSTVSSADMIAKTKNMGHSAKAQLTYTRQQGEQL